MNKKKGGLLFSLRQEQDARRRASMEIGTGIFNPEFANTLSKQTPLEDLKKICIQQIDDSNARHENKLKAENIVNGTQDYDDLIKAIWNLMMSFQGLKNIK